MSWYTFNWLNLLFIPGILIAFTVHELGHALTAYFLGDHSQVTDGKITANPLRHLSVLGGLLFIFIGVGWPKPIVFNAKNFQHRYLDSFLVAAAGPFANIITCLVIFVGSLFVLGFLNLIQQIDSQQMAEIMFFNRASQLASADGADISQNIFYWVIAFSNRVWVANFIIAIISLIPLPPFDGFTAALSLVGLFREKRINDLTDGDELSLTPSDPEVTQTNGANKKQSMADIHFRVGAEYHEQQKFEDAIARYRQAISMDSKYGPAYVNMGLAYKAKDQRNEAIQSFRAATRYATDEKSRSQAWTELHELSALPGIGLETSDAIDDNTGTLPWTDTKPTPDWIAFGVGIFMLSLLFLCTFGLLLVTFIGQQ